MPTKEPIFSRQEQAVVYLFSRHWEDIPGFNENKKRISAIQMRFPDASMVDVATGDEAIEFEYALSSFNHFKPADRKKLKHYKALYIVYWEHDTDEDELRKEIERRLHFTGKIVFICLNDHFGPCVEAGAKCLDACWEFPRTQISKAYSLSDIEQETNRLCKQGVFKRLTPRRDLYRSVGFNKIGSGFIQCDHWRTIHLFTTGYFAEDSIPSKLFVKPTGHQKFSGYFDIRHAFFIEKEKSPDLEAYFKNFYFYPYGIAQTETCLVYSDFNELRYEQGRELYDYLAEKYALGRTSELIEGRKTLARIDKIVQSVNCIRA